MQLVAFAVDVADAEPAVRLDDGAGGGAALNLEDHAGGTGGSSVGLRAAATIHPPQWPPVVHTDAMTTQHGDQRPAQAGADRAPLSAVATRGEAALLSSLRRVLPVAGSTRTTVSRFNSSI